MIKNLFDGYPRSGILFADINGFSFSVEHTSIELLQTVSFRQEDDIAKVSKKPSVL